MSPSSTASPILRFESVSKRYVIDRSRSRPAHSDLGQRLLDLAARPLRALRRAEPPTRWREEVWALKDVTFEVQRGEVFALVGGNGAGKSTLLKLLSRIAEPTAGWIGLNGRVTSLLEVGTGFHPELTGRENVFLNGAILGMSTAEIRARFDRIVEFSGVERYLDTPVKRYSSGMYVRLAFAIASHLDHEIMVVDEVLSVGDAAFRDKCMTRIEALVRDEGRTVLFVSHDLAQVSRLAHRALLIEQGQVKLIGPPATVIGRYLEGTPSPQRDPTAERGPLRDLVATSQRTDAAGTRPGDVRTGAPTTFDFELGPRDRDAVLELRLDLGGLRLLTLQAPVPAAATHARCAIDALPLAPGTYLATASLRAGDQELGRLDPARAILVTADDAWSSGEGPLAVRARWDSGPTSVAPEP